MSSTGLAYLTRFHDSPSVAPSYACLDIVDVSRPDKLVRLGGLTKTTDQISGISVSGGYAYLTSPWEEPLQVVQIMNPREPKYVGSGDRAVSTEELAAGSGYVFVADGDAGLTVFRECGPFYDTFESGDTSAWSATVP